MSDSDEFWADDDRVVEDIGAAVDDLDFGVAETDDEGFDADEREVGLTPDDEY